MIFNYLMPSQVEPQHFEATPLLAPGARVLSKPQAIAVEDVGLVQVWYLRRSSRCQESSQHACMLILSSWARERHMYCNVNLMEAFPVLSRVERLTGTAAGGQSSLRRAVRHSGEGHAGVLRSNTREALVRFVRSHRAECAQHVLFRPHPLLDLLLSLC